MGLCFICNVRNCVKYCFFLWSYIFYGVSEECDWCEVEFSKNRCI